LTGVGVDVEFTVVVSDDRGVSGVWASPYIQVDRGAADTKVLESHVWQPVGQSRLHAQRVVGRVCVQAGKDVE
jgi:hypothetical protein